MIYSKLHFWGKEGGTGRRREGDFWAAVTLVLLDLGVLAWKFALWSSIMLCISMSSAFSRMLSRSSQSLSRKDCGTKNSFWVLNSPRISAPCTGFLHKRTVLYSKTLGYRRKRLNIWVLRIPRMWLISFFPFVMPKKPGFNGLIHLLITNIPINNI